VLTKKQRDLLLFIHEKMQDGDVPPSFEEMKIALNLKSKSGIHRLITALVERGYLERLPHRARALEIKKLPEGFKPKDDDTSNVANLSREITATRNLAALSMISEVPHLGRIAAGTPIEAIRHEGQTMQIPQDILGRGDHYALTVDGDSMINAGIHDRDTVIIKRCDTADNGTIVVALVDDLEVTLKRLRRAGSKIVLEPENDAHEPRILEPARVKIQGKLAGLIRSYH
jgi:repressor LexA